MNFKLHLIQGKNIFDDMSFVLKSKVYKARFESTKWSFESKGEFGKKDFTILEIPDKISFVADCVFWCMSINRITQQNKQDFSFLR